MAADEDDKKKDKDLQVTPEDLQDMVRKIRNFMIPPVKDAKGRMDGVNLVPGNFKDATTFLTTIGPAPNGRANVYSQHLQSLQTALTNFADGLDKISGNYITTEDMNKNLVQKLGEIKQSVTPFLPNGPAA